MHVYTLAFIKVYQHASRPFISATGTYIYLCMRCHAQSVVACVEHDKLGLEEDVAIDGHLPRGRCLHATKAGYTTRRSVFAPKLYRNGGKLQETLTAAADLGKVDVVSGNLGHVDVAHVERQVGQLGVAGEGEAADLGIVLRALNLGVVGRDSFRVGQDERRARVGDALAARRRGLRLSAVDGEALAAELPEALCRVDGDPGQLALELGPVDGAKRVGAGRVLPQVGREDGLGEVGLDVFEKRLLLLGLDRVDLGKGQAHEAVAALVHDKLLGHGRGELDGLVGKGRAADVDHVGADVALGAGAVAVRDPEGGALHGLERGRLGGIEDPVVGREGRRQLLVEDPEIGRARVEVEVDGLSANLDGGDELDVVLLGQGGHASHLICRVAVGGLRGGVSCIAAAAADGIAIAIIPVAAIPAAAISVAAVGNICPIAPVSGLSSAAEVAVLVSIPTALVSIAVAVPSLAATILSAAILISNFQTKTRQ